MKHIMQRKVSLALVALLAVCFYHNIVLGGDNLQFPLGNYLQEKGENYFGRKGLVRAGKWHLGDDINAKAGDNIYAIGAGIVRHAQYHSPYWKNGKYYQNYGGMYIIEHNVNGEKVCAIYVHMNFATFTKSVGQEVAKGEYLGQVGNRQQNGDYVEHFHSGIRKGEYPANPNAYIYGDWIFSGYTANETVLNDWYNPTDFINSPQSTSPAPYTYSAHAYTGTGEVQGGADTNYNYSLPTRKSEFTMGETAKAMVRVENITVKHRWLVEIWQAGKKKSDYAWSWNEVGAGWNASYFWPELNNASAGNWEFKIYLEYDGRTVFLSALPFTVLKPADWKAYAYDGKGSTGYGPPEGGANTNCHYALPGKTTTFYEGDHVYGMIRINDVYVNHRFKVKAYRDNQLMYEYAWNLNDVQANGGHWDSSYFWPELNQFDFFYNYSYF